MFTTIQVKQIVMLMRLAITTAWVAVPAVVVLMLKMIDYTPISAYMDMQRPIIIKSPLLCAGWLANKYSSWIRALQP